MPQPHLVVGDCRDHEHHLNTEEATCILPQCEPALFVDSGLERTLSKMSDKETFYLDRCMGPLALKGGEQGRQLSNVGLEHVGWVCFWVNFLRVLVTTM